MGYLTNIFERYEKRPLLHPEYDFENMPLVESAMLFQPYNLKRQTDDEANVDNEFYIEEDDEDSSLIKLLDQTKMRRRTRSASVRVPYFRVATDPDNFYSSLLLQ